ncbi:hypothetical protein ACVWWN_002189 [Mycobacterium sp. URHB0021]
MRKLNWPMACALMFALLLLVAYPEVMIPVLTIGAAAFMYDRRQARRAAVEARCAADYARASATVASFRPSQPARPTPPSRARSVQAPPIVRCDARTTPLRKVRR